MHNFSFFQKVSQNLILFQLDLFEELDSLGDGAFDRKSLYRRCAIKTDQIAAAEVENEGGFGGSGDGTAVAKDQNVGVHSRGLHRDFQAELRRLLQRHGSLHADGAGGCAASVGDDDVRARQNHRPRFLHVEDVRRRQQIHLPRLSDHLHLYCIAHSRFFQSKTELAINHTNCWKTKKKKIKKYKKLINKNNNKIKCSTVFKTYF